MRTHRIRLAAGLVLAFAAAALLVTGVIELGIAAAIAILGISLIAVLARAGDSDLSR